MKTHRLLCFLSLFFCIVLVNFVHASDSGGAINVIGVEEALSLTYVALGMAVIAFSVAVAAIATKKGEEVE